MIIAIANQKGGTGKTTSAAALACGIRSTGKKILAIDAAPQCNLSHLLGADTTAPGIVELINGAAPEGLIQHTGQADIIAGSRRLAAIQSTIPPQILAERIHPVKRMYNDIVIDTDCALDNALLLALFAADTVVIPAIADVFSLSAIQDLRDTINAANAAGAGVTIGGIFFTQTSGRKTKAEKTIEAAMRKSCGALGIRVYDTQIRRADAVRAAAAFGESIITYDPKSKPAQDYINLIEEITR